MLPMIARILVKESDGKKHNLWLPLFLFWPVLLVLFILCSPLLLLVGLLQVCQLKKNFKILPLLSAIFTLLAACRGLIVDVEEEGTKVKIIIK